MDETGIKPIVIDEIQRLAEKYNISRVILFGSRASGDYRRTSDIDLAVTGGDVVLAGLVGLYEICFEQAWKMMKEILENHGYEEGATGSPKIILKTAYRSGMIQDEELSYVLSVEG